MHCISPLWGATVLLAFPVLTDMYGINPYALGTLSGLGYKVVNKVSVRDKVSLKGNCLELASPMEDRQEQTEQTYKLLFLTQ